MYNRVFLSHLPKNAHIKERGIMIEAKSNLFFIKFMVYYEKQKNILIFLQDGLAPPSLSNTYIDTFITSVELGVSGAS